jgi:hypothetical protein
MQSQFSNSKSKVNWLKFHKRSLQKKATKVVKRGKREVGDNLKYPAQFSIERIFLLWLETRFSVTPFKCCRNAYRWTTAVFFSINKSPRALHKKRCKLMRELAGKRSWIRSKSQRKSERDGKPVTRTFLLMFSCIYARFSNSSWFSHSITFYCLYRILKFLSFPLSLSLFPIHVLTRQVFNLENFKTIKKNDTKSDYFIARLLREEKNTLKEAKRNE